MLGFFLPRQWRPMSPSLPWLEPHAPFPSPDLAWGPDSPAPGLLAAGGTLDAAQLHSAYSQGIFPWFSAGQPILWWSPDPRMVLRPDAFRLQPSLRRTLRQFARRSSCAIRIDHDFGRVIRACAHTPRRGQGGTWITPGIIAAYEQLHAGGHAHSVETWIDGQLVGGLYCVALGRAVFGESMFAHASNASKIALAALVCLCRRHGVALIDCQQNTAHLAFMGAAEMPRADFAAAVQALVPQPAPAWHFEPVYWNALMPPSPADR